MPAKGAARGLPTRSHPRPIRRRPRPATCLPPSGSFSRRQKPVDELLGALTSSGLRVPEKAREKPAFAEHAGEIFWLNLNGKGELWLNAKASKYSDGGGDADGKSNRRPRPRKKDHEGEGAPPDAPAQDLHETPPPLPSFPPSA